MALLFMVSINPTKTVGISKGCYSDWTPFAPGPSSRIVSLCAECMQGLYPPDDQTLAGVLPLTDWLSLA